MTEPTILTLDEIKRRIDLPSLMADIERGFQWFSAGRDGRARTRDNQITIADLTGVAVQDLQIATHVVRGRGAS